MLMFTGVKSVMQEGSLSIDWSKFFNGERAWLSYWSKVASAYDLGFAINESRPH